MKKDSADGRAFIWKISVHAIYNNPLGVGIGNFPGEFCDLQAGYFASGRATEQEEYISSNPQYAFNEYIQICIEFGIFPFTLIILFIYFTIVFGIQNRRLTVVGCIVSLLIFALMSYPFNQLPFLIVFALFIAICNTTQKKVESEFYPNKQSLMRGKRGLVLTVLLISIITVGLCLKNRYPIYNAYKDWNGAQVLYNVNANEEALIIYEKIFPYLNDQVPFIFEYGHCLSKTGQYKKSNEVLQHALKISSDPMFYNIIGKNYQCLKRYEDAEINFTKAANIVPYRIYPNYLLIKLYYENGEVEKACILSEKVLNKPIKIDSPAVQEMKREIKELKKLNNNDQERKY